MKTLREYIDQLDEISRRDFLKTAGAAGLSATDVLAAPWQHQQGKDSMDDSITYTWSAVYSTDGKALLSVHQISKSDLSLLLRAPDVRVDFQNFTRDSRGEARGRLKLGNLKPDNIVLQQLSRGDRTYIISHLNYDFAKTLFFLKHPTNVKIEIPVWGGSNRIYTFEIEPDKTTQQYQQRSAEQDRQRRAEQDRLRQQRLSEPDLRDIIRKSQ